MFTLTGSTQILNQLLPEFTNQGKLTLPVNKAQSTPFETDFSSERAQTNIIIYNGKKTELVTLKAQLHDLVIDLNETYHQDIHFLIRLMQTENLEKQLLPAKGKKYSYLIIRDQKIYLLSMSLAMVEKGLENEDPYERQNSGNFYSFCEFDSTKKQFIPQVICCSKIVGEFYHLPNSFTHQAPPETIPSHFYLTVVKKLFPENNDFIKTCDAYLSKLKNSLNKSNITSLLKNFETQLGQVIIGKKSISQIEESIQYALTKILVVQGITNYYSTIAQRDVWGLPSSSTRLNVATELRKTLSTHDFTSTHTTSSACDDRKDNINTLLINTVFVFIFEAQRDHAQHSLLGKIGLTKSELVRSLNSSLQFLRNLNIDSLNKTIADANPQVTPQRKTK
ncbi:MAG: hypothetical protein KIT27_04155 [Legionellales bacterium]|nr:hypothetical protein [Legionellales bacterium]